MAQSGQHSNVGHCALSPCAGYGVDDGDRTHDNRYHKPVLYQLSYAHHKTIALAVETATAGIGTPGRIRTCDLRLRRPLLYPTELRAQYKTNWSGWRDSNSRPTGPKPVALPDCATPRSRGLGRFRERGMIGPYPTRRNHRFGFRTAFHSPSAESL